MKKIILILTLVFYKPSMLKAQSVRLSETRSQSCFNTELRWKTIVKQARDDEKFILIDFYAPWCSPCKKLELYTFSDGLAKDFVCDKDNIISVKINMGSKDGSNAHPDAVFLSDFFSIESYPTVILLDFNGREISRFEQFLNQDEFIDWLKEAADKYENEDY